MRNQNPIDAMGGGYYITDFYKIAHEFETMSDLRDFIGKAHALGIRVILDVTPNHVSPSHEWVKSAMRYREYSPYWNYLQHSYGNYFNTPDGMDEHLSADGIYFHLSDWALANLNSSFTSATTADRIHRIKTMLVNRKQTELGNEYIESVMRGIQVKVNNYIFRPLVCAIRETLKEQKPSSYDPYYRLSPADILGLGRRFHSQLEEPLLSFRGGSISLEDVLRRIPTAMFVPDNTTLPGITFALHSPLRFISQNYFPVQRARELGLRNSWEVRYNVGMVVGAFRVG